MTSRGFFCSMKRFLPFIVLILCPAAFSCCGQDGNAGNSAEDTSGYALDNYWSGNYSGKYGIQIGTSKSGAPEMTLGDVPLYVTGVNCYNLFVQCLDNDGMDTAEMDKSIEILAKEKVPVVRFSCGPYYASQMHFYLDRKEKYLSDLEELASLCDQNHILLIPSVFWIISCVPEYCGEEQSAWGDTSSKTYKFMLSYTADIVNALKGHRCLAAWEFGAEFNYAADLGDKGYPEIKASAVGTALKGFAETVNSLDGQGRLVGSGHGAMRNAQWHLANDGSWSNDSFSQYVEITGVMTPDAVRGMSEHLYEEPRVFSDLGAVNSFYQLEKAKEAAALLGKVYYVGEFTGPGTAGGDSVIVKKHYSDYYVQKVQLSLVWNYALKGDIVASFKSGTEYGDMTFRYMRALNERFRMMSVE